jgi:hypothetical protein
MLTLTYPLEYPTDGTKVKRDWIAIRHFLVRLGVCGIMVLEFQERGAPYFHLLFNEIELNKKEISSAWYRIVGSGDKKHLKAGTSIQKLRSQHAAESYISKYMHSYMAKFEQKGVPEEYKSVGRFWSRFGKLKVKTGLQIMIRWLSKLGGNICWSHHNFRSTFSTNFLRAGGDPFTLQILVGWTDLEMPRHYTEALKAEDAFRVHIKASPADSLSR